MDILKSQKQSNEKDGKLKTEKKSKRKLLAGNKPLLLEITEFLNLIIQEAANIPEDVKTSLVSTRDTCWQGFIRDQERINHISR